jgi:hypothetical protein
MTAPAEVYALSPPPPLAHEHFPQGGHGRARAIQAFVALIESRQAFLADPFFDAAGAEALLPRMHRDSDLTIVTCLPEASDLESLRRYLRQAAPFLPLKLKVHRVTRRDSKEQAFHDRYVVLMGDEQVPRGFLLSNSFSGAARQYPLVVAEMSPPTTAAVFDDIVALLSHRSIQSIWPPPAEPREQGDSFGKLWRFYLERLVPRAGKTHVQWLDAAKAAGWLELDIDGTPRWSTMRTNEVLDRILGSAPSARWLRRLTSRGGPRLPPIGERVAAVGERAARGLDVTPAEVAGRVPRAKARDLEAFIRTGFRHPEQRDRRRAWLDGIAVHQAMTATEVSLAIVRVGLGFWGDTHAVQDLRQPWGRTFTYRVLLSLDPERAFRVGVELGDPDLIVAALDPWVVEPWGLCVSRAAIHSRSPMVRALGAQSLVAPRERGNFSHAPTSPPPELIGRASVVLQSLDRPTAALCALEWGLHSPHADVRRGLAECFIERYADIATGQRDAVCGAVVNGQRFLEALATVVSIAVANAGEFVEDLLRALEVAVTADHGADGPLDAAADVARILLRASGSSVEGAKRRVRAAFDVDLATSRSGALSPFRRHPDWRVSVVRLSWAQLLFVLIHAHGEVSYGVESLVSFGLVAEVSPTLLARIIADHIPGLAALTEVPW